MTGFMMEYWHWSLFTPFLTYFLP